MRAVLLLAIGASACGGMSVEQFALERDRAACNYRYRCGGIAQYELDECLTNTGGGGLSQADDVVKAVNAHRAIYRQSMARQCLEFLDQADCIPDPAVPYDDPCAKALEGALHDGEPCFTVWDCAGNGFCNSCGGSGTCEGERSAPFVRSAPAEVGVSCNVLRPCGRSAVLYCKLASYFAGTCQPRIGGGEVCHSASGPQSVDANACAPGNFCRGSDGAGTPGACQPLSDEGEICVPQGFSGCREGLLCSSGICVTPPAAGPCVSGTCRWPVAFCDSNGMCVPTTPIRGTCSCSQSDSRCAEGYCDCNAGICRSFPSECHEP